MKITTKKIKLSQIKLNKDNPRILRDEKFKKLKESIQNFPEMLELREVVVDENMMILGGNMRYKALKELKIKETQVKIVEGLTEKQKKEFIIKDNVGFGDWNWDILSYEWDTTELGDWGLDLPMPTEELDYSDKNKEIDVGGLDETSTIVFKFDYESYLETIAKLNNAKEKLGCNTNEQTLIKLLDDYE